MIRALQAFGITLYVILGFVAFVNEWALLIFGVISIYWLAWYLLGEL
jgi:hypothetical protein